MSATSDAAALSRRPVPQRALMLLQQPPLLGHTSRFGVKYVFVCENVYFLTKILSVKKKKGLCVRILQSCMQCLFGTGGESV